MKQIVIIGYGYVGKAMYEFFKDHYSVYVHDPYIDQRTLPNIKFVSQEEAKSM